MILDIIETISKERSRNKKEELIRQACTNSPVFSKVLYNTYHPLRHYRVLKPLGAAKGRGINTLEQTMDDWDYLLSQLADGSLSGLNAQDTVVNFIKSLTEPDAEVFKRILKKDLRAGISAKTINKALQTDFIPLFGAMLATKWSGTITGPLYMSLKLDGLRGIYRNGKIYSRKGHEIIGVSHIIEYIKTLGIEELDGELIIPGLHFQQISGKLRSYKACPETVFHVFDTCEQNKPFNKRYETLKSLQLKGPCKLVKHVLTKDKGKIKSTFDKALNAGYEGLVLKDPDHYYTKGIRSTSWMKMKNILDEDLVIEGFFEGAGKYKGTLGGVIVTRENGVRVDIGTGFTDDLRDEIWNNKSKYLNKTIEVQYHEETLIGSIRHPVFKGFRNDK